MKRSVTVLLLALVLGLGTAFVVTAGFSKLAVAGDNANGNYTVDTDGSHP